MSSLRHVFLLSPASSAGRRAVRLLKGASSWAGASALRQGTVPLGELFTYLSGLYFRGKLAYATHFSGDHAWDGVRVMTATDGLRRPGDLVSLEDLARYRGAAIDADEERFTRPLQRDVRSLAERHPRARFVLLGSIATEKYTTPLGGVLGDRLVFPEAFVGMGDMSRGSTLLRCVEEDRQMAYRGIDAGPRRGARRTRYAGFPVGVLVAAALVAACGPPADTVPVAEGERQAVAASTGLRSGAGQATGTPSAIADSTFARLVLDLSEPGGHFDTDNLISNERSYLHVVDALQARGVRGGAYLGVGPDQNFSYMAAVRPEVAYIVDIRRDNLLQHLWFKALFELAPTRIEYLALMFGRPPPADPTGWPVASIEELVGYVEATPYDRDSEARVWERVQEAVAGAGISLSTDDLSTVGSIFHRFAQAGLALRFTSHYRRPRSYYPTYRDLLLETSLSGEPSSYLASEESYRFLRELQIANRVIPVVGNLAGSHAIREIGNEIGRQELVVSAFYTSNVEFYLMGDGSFDAYAENVRRLPVDEGSVIIRSYFTRFSAGHPQAVPGYASVQLLHPIEAFTETVAGEGFRGYRDLVTRDAVPLKQGATVGRR